MSEKVCVGIGNEYRSDDGVGLYIVRELKKQMGFHENITFVETSGETSQLISLWENKKKVLLFDALSSGDEIGKIFRIDPSIDVLPKEYLQCSTHNMGLWEAIEFSKVLNKMPSEMLIYGINSVCFDPGLGLSSEVEESAKIVVEQMILKLKEL